METKHKKMLNETLPKFMADIEARVAALEPKEKPAKKKAAPKKKAATKKSEK